MTDTRSSFETEALPHAGLLVNVARLLGAGSEAADLVQEVYARAWRDWDQFQPGTNCKAWLITILRSIRIDGIRHQVCHGGAHEQLPVDLSMPPAAPRHSYKMDDFGDELHAALLALPAPQCKALLMVTFQEMTYAEVAELQGVAESTAKTRVHRACLTLRERLGGYALKERITR